MEYILISQTAAEQINKAPVSSLLTFLEYIAAQYGFDLKNPKHFKKCVHILKLYVTNN